MIIYTNIFNIKIICYFMKDFEENQYFYLPKEKLPSLVLAVKDKYDFKEGREWVPIKH